MHRRSCARVSLRTLTDAKGIAEKLNLTGDSVGRASSIQASSAVTAAAFFVKFRLRSLTAGPWAATPVAFGACRSPHRPCSVRTHQPIEPLHRINEPRDLETVIVASGLPLVLT